MSNGDVKTAAVIGLENDLDPISLPTVKNARHIFSQHITHGSVQSRILGNVVGRTSLYDSRTAPTADGFTNGLRSIANNLGLTLTTTITSKIGAIFILVPEVSFYIDQIATSNEWPTGSFFTATGTGKNLAKNFDLVQYMSRGRSTDASLVLISRIVNNTGASVDIGVILGARYIINAGGTT